MPPLVKGDRVRIRRNCFFPTEGAEKGTVIGIDKRQTRKTGETTYVVSVGLKSKAVDRRIVAGRRLDRR